MAKLLVAFILFFGVVSVAAGLESIWAVNAGGGSHVDSHGVRYQADTNADGIPSDYGKSLRVSRVGPQDQILYQTERYHTEDFEYSFPTPRAGDYVLVLKFCEVWFAAPDQKVFDVTVNGVTVISNLDIFSKAGRGIAHDEYVPFKVKGGKVSVADETVSASNGVTITFVKGHRDNPKVNALFVMKGTIADVPMLPPLKRESPDDALIDEEEEEMREDDDHHDDPSANQAKTPQQRKSHVSGQKVADPYSVNEDSSSLLIPLAVCLAAVLPLLYCLCRI